MSLWVSVRCPELAGDRTNLFESLVVDETRCKLWNLELLLLDILAKFPEEENWSVSASNVEPNDNGALFN